MDATAEWRVETDAPVPHLVAESLHEKGAVIRHGAGCGRLVVQVLEQVLDREVVESGALAQPLRSGGGTHAAQLAHHLAERSAKLDRPTWGVSFPERYLSGLARRRIDDDL